MSPWLKLKLGSVQVTVKVVSENTGSCGETIVLLQEVGTSLQPPVRGL